MLIYKYTFLNSHFCTFLDWRLYEISTIMEQVHTMKKYQAYYKENKADSSDKAFLWENIRMKSHATKRLL